MRKEASYACIACRFSLRVETAAREVDAMEKEKKRFGVVVVE